MQKKKNMILSLVVFHGSTNLESTITTSLRQNSNDYKNYTLMLTLFMLTTTTPSTRFSKNQPNTVGAPFKIYVLDLTVGFFN